MQRLLIFGYLQNISSQTNHLCGGRNLLRINKSLVYYCFCCSLCKLSPCCGRRTLNPIEDVARLLHTFDHFSWWLTFHLQRQHFVLHHQAVIFRTVFVSLVFRDRKPVKTWKPMWLQVALTKSETQKCLLFQRIVSSPISVVCPPINGQLVMDWRHQINPRKNFLCFQAIGFQWIYGMHRFTPT